MAEIHRKAPVIKKRMASFHAKKQPKKQNVHVERLKSGARTIGAGIWGQVKKLGDPKVQKRLGDIGQNMGEMSGDFFGSSYSGTRKRKRGKR